jgi:hypothetical protein
LSCRQNHKTIQQLDVQINEIDLYPKYPGCKDYYDKNEQLECLTKKINLYIEDLLKKNYQTDLKYFKDTIWLKFMIDTAGNTHFQNFIHFSDSLPNETHYNKIFDKIAKYIPKMAPAIYRDKPVNFEFKLPVIVIQDTIN